MSSRPHQSLLDLRPLLGSGAVLFLGMTVGNAGAYFLNLVVGRLLGPADFGSFVSLVAMGSMAAMPAGALATVGAKFASTYVAQNELGKVRSLDTLLNRWGLLLGAAFLIVVASFSHPIRQFLNLESRTPVLVLGVSFALCFAMLVVRGLLQGLQRFTDLAVNTGIEPILKVVGALLFIRLGFAVNGALASLAIAFLICYLLARGALRSLQTSPAQPIDQATLWRYALPTIISLIGLAVLTAVDVVLVKHYFSATDAGLYAGLSTVSKIILFVSTPLVTVMFPLIATKVSQGDRHWPLLAQTVGLITLLSTAVLVAFAAAPELVVRLLFGSAYLAAAPYLPALGLAMLFLSLATVLTHYFLSIGQTHISWLVALALVAEIASVAQWHATLGTVINDLTAVFGGLLVALVGAYLVAKRQRLSALVGHRAVGGVATVQR